LKWVYEAITNVVKRKVFANAVFLRFSAKRLIEKVSLSWNEKYLFDVAIIERESVYVKVKPLVST